MTSDGDYEDGEILEEGEEPTQASPSTQVSTTAVPTSSSGAPAITSSIAPPKPPNESFSHAHHTAQTPLLPIPSPGNPRKRLHSSLHMSHVADFSSVYDNRTPLSHRQPTRYNTNGTGDRRQAPSHDHQDDRLYNADLIVKYPRQEPQSQVLLDFATWMATARSRKRLDVEDVQKIILNVLRGGEDGVVSPYLMPSLMPGGTLPTKVCVVLLGRMHPSVLQKYRAKLGFFDKCSSVPLMLTKQEESQIRRSEAPLPELMYRFPRPTVDTHELSANELFYAHELTFLMKHSAGYTDELVFTPEGKFCRKSQPLGGTWELDGDLLHLKWRQRVNKAAGTSETATEQDTTIEEEDDDAYTLDVLVCEDGGMHEFRTDALTDETYAHKVPEHLAKKRRGDSKPRSIWLSLAKAIAMDVPRSADGSLILRGKAHQNDVPVQETPSKSAEANGNGATEERQLNPEAFKYYTLTLAELQQHGYPTDVVEEQRQLEEATGGNTRDRYVATKPRPTPGATASTTADESEDGEEEEGEAMETEETLEHASSGNAGGDFIYALDCEMCETDIGMELTRVTVVDVKGAVVYDQLVKPQSTIINYHTEFSGISEETLRDTKCILADVQRELCNRFLFSDTILVGHSLTSDLRALRLVHPTIADTSILYPHQRGFPFRTSLKYLTKTFLKKDIQMEIQAGHDSAEDAIASLELLLLKVREGPWFGIPESVSSGSAFDSMADKTFALEKKMTMLRLQCSDKRENPAADTEENVAETACTTKRKPWDLSASGDLKAHTQSPFRHAQAVKAKADTSSPNSGVASTIVKTEDCSSWEALKASVQEAMDVNSTDSSEADTRPDLCWVEIEPPSASAALCNDFVGQHGNWMAEQRSHCESVDNFLQQLRDEVLPKGTLLLVIPQGDLSLLRYLKGMRTRSKWRDATPTNDDLGTPEELHAAVGDAFRGAMDSCLFLTQK
ncbi:hypothetical protein PHYBOEH_000212 [Phytophthora boehmeriae]|uniref:Exonuclease domain-containing protein n=1 Tax=Phytophthora boehmeriae TaxID=109152 RepID=A0A8T1WZV3_9STRA|nr:hypothetical protein PHYBOEH_000212 [Phytophthora boehmeriae]